MCVQVMRKLGASRKKGGGLILSFEHFSKGLGLDSSSKPGQVRTDSSRTATLGVLKPEGHGRVWVCPGGGVGGGQDKKEGSPTEGGGAWEGVVDELSRQVKKRPRALKSLRDGLAQVREGGRLVQQQQLVASNA